MLERKLFLDHLMFPFRFFAICFKTMFSVADHNCFRFSHYMTNSLLIRKYPTFSQWPCVMAM